MLHPRCGSDFASFDNHLFREKQNAYPGKRFSLDQGIRNWHDSFIERINLYFYNDENIKSSTLLRNSLFPAQIVLYVIVHNISNYYAFFSVSFIIVCGYGSIKMFNYNFTQDMI